MTRDTPEVGTPLTRAVEEFKEKFGEKVLSDEQRSYAPPELGGIVLEGPRVVTKEFTRATSPKVIEWLEETFNRIHTLGIQEGRELERAEQSIAHKKSGV